MANRITEPGIYNMPEADYHADPCPEPSLSASIATRLIDRSPIHAWEAHPRLNPAYEAEAKGHYDIGSAAHALVIEGRDLIDIIDAPDWRKKDAKEAREESREAGRIPLLTDAAEHVYAMMDAFYRQVRSIKEIAGAVDNFMGEQTVIWREGDIWCRCRPDILPAYGDFLLDYKTTGGSAHPQMWAASRLYEGPDLQAAFYTRGCRSIGLGKNRMIFLVQETSPPFALSAVAISPEGMDAADASVNRAIRAWGQCLRSGEWPGYPSLVFHSEPTWRSDKRRAVVDEVESMTGRPALETGMQMQAPSKKEIA